MPACRFVVSQVSLLIWLSWPGPRLGDATKVDENTNLITNHCQMSIRNGLFLLLFLLCQDSGIGQFMEENWITPFERDSSWSATRQEAHDYLDRLSAASPRVQTRTCGVSDGFLPLYEVVISADGETDPVQVKASGRTVVLINNAIHPGESEGVDACLMLARELAFQPDMQALLTDLVVVILPYYNADGGLLRSPTYRANQNGPRLQGFRGNGRNLDLNRDFIKCDSRNAFTFSRLFQKWDPDIFVDTHTSNGADYQATITVIATQPDKIPPALAEFQQQTLLPGLYRSMARAGWPMTPYVHTDGPPETGIHGFLDLPRYSTGYTALFQSLGFMPETHMLKPFPDRVRSTHRFLHSILHLASAHREDLLRARAEARNQALNCREWPIRWTLDRDRKDSLLFRGYQHTYKTSPVTGMDRLFYDRSQPYERIIPYFPRYRAVATVSRPVGWILPQAYTDIIERLAVNQVQMYRIEGDTVLQAPVLYISSEKTYTQPYEGHYPHVDVQVEERKEEMLVRTGDLWVPSDQKAIAYLMATMDPRAPDSWFAWNFMDGILDQKEYFSAYVFEDLAADWMKEHPELQEELNQALLEHPEWNSDPRAILDWIYRHSPYYEPTHRRYPILAIPTPVAWSLKPFTGVEP